ncbi:uncharacterized protein LOC129744341 [Uranotaenia lowii]|uniref:uncharacterized protein LOC129744341 n=1 Tax=Uranotaenia lowii TaxID=190385 RepID=UPI002479D552|nr:uncharacterized protein LOC129744341 [Uranotaenia lowii]
MSSNKAISFAIFVCLAFFLLFKRLDARPLEFEASIVQNVTQNLQKLDASINDNIIRKDFYILEYPEEIIAEEVDAFMQKMEQRRQFELDRYIARLFSEFKKREQDGTLDVARV